MALRLVNTFPGSLPDPFKPGHSIHLGMKETSSSVRLGSIEVATGSTAIAYDGTLPESSPVLNSLSAEVSYVTTEHRQPYAATEVAKSISGGNILFTKSNASIFEKCLYEVKYPAKLQSSALGYVKFKTNTSWAQQSVDWCSLSQMAGPYFAFEHGSFNTAIYGFLRNNGSGGALVAGGPMQSFNSARPGQTQAPLAWLSSPNGTVIELWFFFNISGYSPTFIPTVEVWSRVGETGGPEKSVSIPLASLGTFPANTFPNFRTGAGEDLVLTFGLPGASGDTLEVIDWKLYPDFRLSVSEGMELGGSTFRFSPDAPVFFRAGDGRTPEDVLVGRWSPVLDAGFIRPRASLYYPPGKTTPYAVNFEKWNQYAGAFCKEEPRLETSEGAFIEAFMYGSQTERVGDSFGGGISIDDGTSVYRAIMVETAAFKTIGISKNDYDFTEAGYYLPSSNIDWGTPKLIRLAVDNTRDVVSLFVDEELALEVDTSDPLNTFPSSPGTARVSFGNLLNNNSRGFSRFVEVNYSPRYRAFEATDQLLPTAAPYDWTLVGPLTGAAVSSAALEPVAPDAEYVEITKEDPSMIGSYIYFERADDFDLNKGMFADFETSFGFYADAFGNSYGAEALIDAGVNVEFGNKVLKFRFFESGLLGKFIGIIPGSGSDADIVAQNALGKRFSFPVDWTQRQRYRIVVRGGTSIEVWVGTTMQAPAITIPWSDLSQQFDLPTSVAPAAIAFGHFGNNTVSNIQWYHFRYGISNGYEVAVAHVYDGEPPEYLFGGSVFARSEFDV